MKNKTPYIILFCFYLCAVLYLCLMKPDDIPHPEINLLGIPIDKAAHFLMFLPYPFLSYMLFHKKDRNIFANLCILIILYVAGVGLAYGTEHLQGMTDYRTQDMTDVYADLTGMIAGCIITFTYILIERAYRHINENR